jgi:2-dehydro-3-deoxyphosphooctonate aldolase (KDO 8-P synthase)
VNARTVRAVRVGEPGVEPVTVGGGSLVLIGGPCVIEGEALALRTADRLTRETAALGIGFIYKSSYAKENRGTERNFRGLGAAEGLEILAKVRREVGVPVLSDVHAETEIPAAAEVLDVLQIPAYLCQQTGLVIAAAATGRALNVKKGQFLAPENMAGVVSKVESAGNHRLLLTERGSCFGYNRLVCDYRSLPIMRALGYPVVFDATHIIRLYGIPSSDPRGGEPEYAPMLARAAVAAGTDAVFIETHPEPSRALCDAASMLALETMPRLLAQLAAIHATVRGLGIATGEGGHPAA